jgi:hypothetical protein
MGSPFETIKRYLPSGLKNQLGRVGDFLVYHCLPPKTIVLVMSSARSGSTLLKALLGEAQDISHLPEVDYSQYGVNSYYVYRKAYFLSQKRIIVLKYPGVTTKLVPSLDRIKIIVLVRDTYGVVRSLQKRRGDSEKHKHWTEADWVRHWCRVYQWILDAVQSMNTDFCFVRYEDLLRDSRATTKKLFTFLGSRQTEGVERYHDPENFRWEWGKDDASENIKGLRIIHERSSEKPQNDGLQSIIENSQGARSLREKFGYLSNNSIKSQKLMKYFV